MKKHHPVIEPTPGGKELLDERAIIPVLEPLREVNTPLPAAKPEQFYRSVSIRTTGAATLAWTLRRESARVPPQPRPTSARDDLETGCGFAERSGRRDTEVHGAAKVQTVRRVEDPSQIGDVSPQPLKESVSGVPNGSGDAWTLWRGGDPEAAAVVSIPAEAAWRVWTRSMDRDEARRQLQGEGDPAAVRAVERALVSFVAIMA